MPVEEAKEYWLFSKSLVFNYCFVHSCSTTISKVSYSPGVVIATFTSILFTGWASCFQLDLRGFFEQNQKWMQGRLVDGKMKTIIDSCVPWVFVALLLVSFSLQTEQPSQVSLWGNVITHRQHDIAYKMFKI